MSRPDWNTARGRGPSPTSVVSVTASAPSGLTRFFWPTATGMGRWVNTRWMRPITMSVLPAMPACTALRARESQKMESCAFAGTLRIM